MITESILITVSRQYSEETSRVRVGRDLTKLLAGLSEVERGLVLEAEVSRLQAQLDAAERATGQRAAQ